MPQPQHAHFDTEGPVRAEQAVAPGKQANSKNVAATTYTVVLNRLPEGVYHATSEDIDGLVLETRTLKEMEAAMRECIPWLLEDNHDIRVLPEQLSISRDRRKAGQKIAHTVSHPA